MKIVLGNLCERVFGSPLRVKTHRLRMAVLTVSVLLTLCTIISVHKETRCTPTPENMSKTKMTFKSLTSSHGSLSLSLFLNLFCLDLFLLFLHINCHYSHKVVAIKEQHTRCSYLSVHKKHLLIPCTAVHP